VPRHITTLVTDQDPGIRKLISRILIGSGHRVHEASSCEEACRAVTRLGPHLLVLSLDTADCPGGEAIALLRSETEAPILALSSRDDEAHFHRNVDDRQRLLHRLCRLRMTVAGFASYLRAGARWCVLYRGFHPGHVQGRAVPQGSLPKCRGANRLRCRRGLEERSKSRSEDSGQKQTSTSSFGFVSASGQSCRESGTLSNSGSGRERTLTGVPRAK
jgi:CheY-like chemotaxis protein